MHSGPGAAPSTLAAVLHFNQGGALAPGKSGIGGRDSNGF
jgi:hypothetical protein